MYKGVGKQGFIQPKVLAEYDIIVTTYNTLKADFYHVMADEGMILKVMKSFHRINCIE